LAAYLERRADGKPLGEYQSKEHCGILTEVVLEREGKTDPVVGHLADGALVTQYHLDSFKKPPGATALGWSKGHSHRHCEAFRVGCPEAAVYGLQFHPEPTLQMLQAKGRDTQWLNTIPPLTDLQRVVSAGERALRAWIKLASARRTKRGREAS
jgi:GMP synthase-like glutamine amidotransferase